MKILSMWLVVEFVIKLIVCKKDLSLYDYLKGFAGGALALISLS